MASNVRPGTTSLLSPPTQLHPNTDLESGYVLSRALSSLLLTPLIPIKTWLTQAELDYVISKHLRESGITRHLRGRSSARLDLKTCQLWRFAPPGTRYVTFDEIIPLLSAECHVIKHGITVNLPKFAVNEPQATATVLKAGKKTHNSYVHSFSQQYITPTKSVQLHC
eukprot:scpid102524/ scgid2299/ 